MTKITILTTRDNHTATKTFHRQADGRIRVEEYNSGTWFTATEASIANIDELYDLLQVLQSEPQRMIIQGQLKAEYSSRPEVTRTRYDDPEKGQLGMFQDVPSGAEWMMCDFDKIALPPGMTPRNGVEQLVQSLPAEFADVSYCYQFSSSAGVSGDKVVAEGEPAVHYGGWNTLSAHVFFCLATPLRNLAQWARNLNATRGVRVLDPAPLQCVQPCYTAGPHFVGMADPLAENRCGLVRKPRNAVSVQWIDAPPAYVAINGERHRVGSTVLHDGQAYIATPSLQDRLTAIVPGNRRNGLKQAIGYYFWYHGSAGQADEIKHILHNAFPGGIKNYLEPRSLNSLVHWYAQRNLHPPMYQDKADADALNQRLVMWRAEAANRLPENHNDFSDWEFDLEASGLTYYYIEGECGLGKTEWLLDRIGNKPDRYVVCLPRIDMIREAAKRLDTKYPRIYETKGYMIETIYTDKDNDIRDTEDELDDEHSSNDVTVTEQVRRFRDRIDGRRHVVLFITHAAMLLTAWDDWGKFHLLVDEVPEPYHAFTRNFKNTGDFVQQFVEVDHAEETNYYKLGLTREGEAKFKGGNFDDNEASLRGLLEGINRPNINMFALRASWDAMNSQRVQLMRLVDAFFLAPFRTVTVMGDEFRRSMLALSFENKYGVDWQPHPDWHPSRKRQVPLAQRARIFYFASKEERRGSITAYEDGNIIPKLLGWFDDPENDPGQVLITSNRRFERYFEKLKLAETDIATHEGVYTQLVQKKKIARRWKAPRLAGTDEYKHMSNVAFFAAMRPGVDEKQFVERSLLLDEEDIIRWREYNPLYQFIMRGCLRKFDSAEVCNVYVFDEWQAEYLRDRFGGCLEYIHVKDVFKQELAINKGGRPTKNINAMSAAERKRNQRLREKNEKLAGLDAAMAKARQD